MKGLLSVRPSLNSIVKAQLLHVYWESYELIPPLPSSCTFPFATGNCFTFHFLLLWICVLSQPPPCRESPSNISIYVGLQSRSRLPRSGLTRDEKQSPNVPPDITKQREGRRRLWSLTLSMFRLQRTLAVSRYWLSLLLQSAPTARYTPCWELSLEFTHTMGKMEKKPVFFGSSPFNREQHSHASWWMATGCVATSEYCPFLHDTYRQNVYHD